ncbi:MAG TPA: UGSC family (seleno)protein, partial [Verrucomicrobiae bacterium]|nr:UGSC family (seleno)protein [Verrucomicrobiae bacterium]
MGIPSVPVITKAFKNLVILNAAKRGMPHERITFTPHPVWGKTPAELRAYVNGPDPVSGKPMMKEIVASLTTPLTEDEKKVGMVSVSIGPPTFTDTLDNLQEFYMNNGYTDFMPIIVPTEEKVETMLK